MRENAKAVESTTKVVRFQAALNFIEALKTIMWISDEKLENAEDVELSPELKATVENITAKAEKLNNRNQEPKKTNPLKGLKGNVQVVNAPTIQQSEFHYDNEKGETINDNEISD